MCNVIILAISRAFSLYPVLFKKFHSTWLYHVMVGNPNAMGERVYGVKRDSLNVWCKY